MPVTLTKGVLEGAERTGNGCDPTPVGNTVQGLFGSAVMPADEANEAQTTTTKGSTDG